MRFSTYAVPMIMGEIKRFLRDDGLIKVSRSLKELANKALAMKEQLKTYYIGNLAYKIADAIGSDPEDIVHALKPAGHLIPYMM